MQPVSSPKKSTVKKLCWQLTWRRRSVNCLAVSFSLQHSPSHPLPSDGTTLTTIPRHHATTLGSTVQPSSPPNSISSQRKNSFYFPLFHCRVCCTSANSVAPPSCRRRRRRAAAEWQRWGEWGLGWGWGLIMGCTSGVFKR